MISLGRVGLVGVSRVHRIGHIEVPFRIRVGRGVDRLMPAVLKVHGNWSTKVKTRDLNDWLAMAVQRHPPPAVNGKRIKPKYMAQTKARPPTFVLMATRADQMPEQYRRYLINSLRESFDLPGVPIRISVRSGKNPYAEGESKGGAASFGQRAGSATWWKSSHRATPTRRLSASVGRSPMRKG